MNKTASEELVRLYLDLFHYEDWNSDGPDDGTLRVGDYVSINRQDHEGYDHPGPDCRIELHWDSGLPVFVANFEEPPNDGGDFIDIHECWMAGYDFARIPDPFKEAHKGSQEAAQQGIAQYHAQQGKEDNVRR